MEGGNAKHYLCADCVETREFTPMEGGNAKPPADASGSGNREFTSMGVECKT